VRISRTMSSEKHLVIIQHARRCKIFYEVLERINTYSFRPIILFANVDVSRHILMVEISILAKSNMGRRK
jgi:hypothetical protein